MLSGHHLHLILNHIPMISLPLAFIFYLFGVYKKDISIQKFSLLILLLTSLLVAPTYFTGESAEHVVEKIGANMEHYIEPHEEAAEISLIVVGLTSAVALLGLFIGRNKQSMPKIYTIIVSSFTLISIGSLIITANLGGKIRHTEMRGNSAAAPFINSENSEHED